MTTPLEELERRIENLRIDLRRATIAGDSVRARELRAELRRTDKAWEDALAALAPSVDEPELVGHPGSLLSIRDQVHQALTLVGVASAPKLIAAVQDAFFGGGLGGSKLTHLRRDEERSFRSSPYARPYYLCSALTADRLTAARGLLAVSTWPLSRRMIGPLSPRVDFLSAAINVAERVGRMGEPTLPAMRLLWRFATTIPGAGENFDVLEWETVAEAARAELAIHSDADLADRDSAATRAGSQLDDVQQLFGAVLEVVSRSTTEH
ncbi:hypothetical protein ACWEKR_08265 [Nocardia sp. NPDC004573]